VTETGLRSRFRACTAAKVETWIDCPVRGKARRSEARLRSVASVLRAQLRGSKPPQPFRYRHQGSLATIGRQSAVADFGRVKLTGALAWWLWGAVHLAIGR
jgi:NADH dehydrogenase FAD-containing subunit